MHLNQVENHVRSIHESFKDTDATNLKPVSAPFIFHSDQAKASAGPLESSGTSTRKECMTERSI